MPDERTAERAAVSRAYAPAAVFPYICLDLFGLPDHRRKFGVLVLVKSVIADAENAVIDRERRDNMTEVALPVAAGARQQHDCGRFFISERIYLHLPTPPRYPLFAFSSVSSDSS